MQAKKDVLKNGLRVLTVPSEDSESLTMIVAVKAGSINEKEEVRGISHILEHMVFKGTKKRPKAQIISEEADGIGAQINAYTDKERTAYYLKAQSIHFEKMADILSDLIINPLIDKDELTKEKNVILEEKKMYEDNPRSKAEDIFEGLMFEGTNMAPLIIGETKSIKNVQREDLLSYMKNYYITKNMAVVLAGKIPENYLDVLEEKFKDLTEGEDKEQIVSGSVTEGLKSQVHYKDMGQANIVVGFPSINYKDENFQTLNLFNLILGGSMSSRLFSEVREKRGLAYAVRSSLSDYGSLGYLDIFAGVGYEKAEEALEVILETTKKAVEEITEEELTRAKEQAKGNLVLALEDSFSRAEISLRKEFNGLPLFSLKESLEKIDKIKLEEVKQIAKKVINHKNIFLAVVGPFKNSEKFDKIIGDFNLR